MVTGGNRTYIWDPDNRLDTVTTGGASSFMSYDYTGIRVKKDGSGGITTYPFSGYEIDPNGVTTKYIRIGIENVAAKKSTGDILFYHNDHLGGVNVITDDFGSRVQLIEYDPWGKVSRDEGIGDSLRRFTGHMLDPESGLYYYGGRYYDPELGRFISPDPFVPQFDDPQSLNRYSYVVNNPVNNIDPDGYFHQVKKKKKKGGFFRRFFGIFSIVIGIITLQPELAALGAGAEAGVSLVNIGIGLASIGRGIADLASGTGGLGARGPPGALGSPDFGLDLGVGEFLGEFFSPALQLAAQAGCDTCPDSRLDLLRVLTAAAGTVDYGPYKVSNPELRRRLEIFAGQIDRRVIITSGDRTPATNREAFGVPASRHLSGQAADFKVEGLTVNQAARLADKATLPGGEPLFPGVGFEFTHVHVDIRNGPPVRFIRNPRTGVQRVVPGFE